MIYIVIIQTDVWSIERYFLGYPPFPVVGNEGFSGWDLQSHKMFFQKSWCFWLSSGNGGPTQPNIHPLENY